ncbi:salicylate hydroxylase [Achaetomium macrosporum]|uniref:Salicylate hydroxylase n=1 Tax=Achaetomium macrosporum TaxID=79813 RepID=A0AAN7CAT1_9PEZI|nr:salicylate hydroxylase [Achaetomium macrosporum]
MAAAHPQPDPDNLGLQVAIIGAGITGITLALGLKARGVLFTIYERASGFREIGAGIGFSPNAERAMEALNTGVLSAFKRVANPNGQDYFQWVDGYRSGELMFKLYLGKDGFQGCRRSDILEEWAKQLPASAVRFGKEIDTITESGPGRPLLLHFKDGTSAFAHAAIGCDGIRSRVRQLILSPINSLHQPLPSPAGPSYTGKFCFRVLAPMGLAMSALGEQLATTRFMYTGPDAHVVTYPVADNTLLNILVVLSDASETWQHAHFTAPGSKAEVLAAFSDWTPTVRTIVDRLLPSGELEKWAIFDMAQYPCPFYAQGRVCIAGDAAHAAGPHLGAGGGMGIEDALVLSELLLGAQLYYDNHSSGGGDVMLGIEKALAIYSDVRYARTQEVVSATREACDLFQWKDGLKVGRDPERFAREVTRLFHGVWAYDLDGMVTEALNRLAEEAVKGLVPESFNF